MNQFWRISFFFSQPFKVFICFLLSSSILGRSILFVSKWNCQRTWHTFSVVSIWFIFWGFNAILEVNFIKLTFIWSISQNFFYLVFNFRNLGGWVGNQFFDRVNFGLIDMKMFLTRLIHYIFYDLCNFSWTLINLRKCI